MHNARILLDVLTSRPDRHSILDDVQGLLSGAIIAALGIFFLGSAGLITGGMAGLAFLLHYATGWSFGRLFFLLNLPFYVLSYRRLGLVFTLKTFAAIALTSFLADMQGKMIQLTSIQPLWASLVGGLLLSFGLLALYRHRASLGGIGILAIWLQESFGIRAGLVQLGFDLTILALSFLVAPPATVLTSIIGAVVLNLFIAINHRRDRYIAY